jgi:hypothetical protein
MNRVLITLLFLLSLIVMGFAVWPASAKDKPPSSDTAKAAAPVPVKEDLVVAWPAGEKWVIEQGVPKATGRVDLYYPEGQSSMQWTEMMIVEITPGQKRVNVPGMARMVYLGTKRGSPNATWDILTKGNNKDNLPLIVFEIKCPDFITGDPPQVQLWKMINGQTGLFTLQYSYKGENFPAERRDQILKVLEKSEIKAEPLK